MVIRIWQIIIRTNDFLHKILKNVFKIRLHRNYKAFKSLI